MKFFITFALFFLASYIFCQTVVTRNVQNSSSNSNGIQTDISTETVLWSNGSTVVTKTVTVNGQTTKTVFVSNDGSTPAPDVTLTGSSTNIQDSNGVRTETVVNTYSNATTVTIKTVTQGNTITKTTTVAGPSGTNTWTSVTTGGSPSTTSTTGGSPSTPAPSTPAPTVSTPAPTVSTPAPAVSTPSTSTATQNPVTLDSSDIYSKYNYKVPSSISYADIRNIHLEYINGARDCMGIQNATWDDTIAAHAQVWANTCNIFHANDNTSPPNPFTTDENVGEGENIYNFAGTGLKATDAMVKGLLFFNGESSVYDCTSNSCSGTCGHYTQNVWYRSTRIGCGVAECNGGFYGVCRYAARGNFNWPKVHPFGSAENCKAGVGSPRNQGYEACKARISATGRSLTSNGAVQSQTTTQTTATNTNKSAPFFNSDSQIVVFALAIVITVIVAACFIVLVVIAKRNSHKELDYQLLESK